MLDHVLALLMQADASCKVLDDRSNIKEFERQDIFASAQKNETQLRFKKTCENPGRKKKHTPFRLEFRILKSCNTCVPYLLSTQKIPFGKIQKMMKTLRRPYTVIFTQPQCAPSYRILTPESRSNEKSLRAKSSGMYNIIYI